MIPFPFPWETPFVEGAVLGAGVFAFGRWRNRYDRSIVGTVVWLVGITAAILAGIDLWNWLPDWGHQGTGLFQAFLAPTFFNVLPGGGLAPNYFLSVNEWMPQAYTIATIAAGFCILYLLGARQRVRLRWAMPRAAGLAAVIILLRIAWAFVAPYLPHRGEIMALLSWAQFVILFLSIPVLAVVSARLARKPPDSPGSGGRSAPVYGSGAASR